jgi:16S rRNA (uracil1498-N3)-methyltransferase
VSGFRPRFFVPASTDAPARDDAPGADGGPEPLSGTGMVLALDEEDSYHGLRVLRLRPGDECEVVMGVAVYAATVLPASAGSGEILQVRLDERLLGQDAGALYRHQVVLVQALARPAAVDWSLEKSTEVGASLILLVPADGSPRAAGKDSKGRVARWERIAREAAKQSKQPAVPLVELAPSLAAARDRVASLGASSILLHPGAHAPLYETVVSLRVGSPYSLEGASAGGDGLVIALWVGPEGGWSDKELDDFSGAGILSARLGRGVLRTETAGPVAVAIARLALGDW